MSKPQIWHTVDELKDIQPYSIVFLTRGDWKLHEATSRYAPSNITQGEPRYLCNNMRLDNRDIWLWCKREDLFNKTNLGELTEDLDKKGGTE